MADAKITTDPKLKPLTINVDGRPVVFVPIQEAVRRLGISHNSVLRRIKLGALHSCRDPHNGYRYVPEYSIDQMLKLREDIAKAVALPGSRAFWSDEAVEKELEAQRVR